MCGHPNHGAVDHDCAPFMGRRKTPWRTPEPWWSINGEVLLDALRRANQGENADLLYAELYANTESQEGAPDAQ